MNEQDLQQERSGDLFTAQEAQDIAGQNASGAPQPSALERAVERVRAVQGAKSGGAGWDRLFERYPEAGGGKLDAEIFEGVRAGLTPTEAYQQSRLRAMQEQERLRQSAARAVGPLAGEGGPQAFDPFLAGLNHKN